MGKSYACNHAFTYTKKERKFTLEASIKGDWKPKKPLPGSINRIPVHCNYNRLFTTKCRSKLYNNGLF